MVLVGDKKYACETCIKGHRSSNCKHVDRPLYEIKKKGRPVTQCDHCRELRKTKQVHVKCICEVKQTEVDIEATLPSTATSAKKGGKKVPTSPAFPGGLPETLEASVTLKLLSESSDSEHEMHASTCTCKTIGVCSCFVPRAAASRSKKTNKTRAPVEALDDEPVMTQPAALVASANSGRNRPVLPRPAPSPHSRSSPPRSVQNPTGVHHQRSQAHFSPYERAYEYAHGSDVGAELSMPFSQPSGEQYQENPTRDLDPRSLLNLPRNPNTDEFTAFMNSWVANVQPSLQPSDVPSVACDCGPNCACPGCIIHRGPSAAPQSFESCVNPSTCSSCMDCTMLTAIDSAPVFEEWFRRMSAADGASDNSNTLLPNSTSSPPPQFDPTSERHNPQSQHFDPTVWQSYALWPNLQHQFSGPPPLEDGASMCCASQCKCPPKMCACPAECCSGCGCSTCSHESRSTGTSNGKTLTFAVSGERAPCCSRERQNMSPSYNQQAEPPSAGTSSRSPGEVNFNASHSLDLRGVYEEWSGPDASNMEVPRVSLSRASSSSSRSSSQRSHRSSSQGFTPSPTALTPDGGVGACCTSMQTLSTSRPESHHSSSNANSPIPPSYSPSHLEQFSGAPFDIDDGSPRIF
ncbi:uncharacterized protein PHACADRAFT_254049 [Phanerochaete carnosa HHB-10118-sp]|uniref:Copper-fist domain-containing protein n=1 Tax=Phanerochaete carnosa (strain HHB-10118-sp) TaxID=650164 RepID=K5V2J6_PHACS|nr:uncharacterized protein PHACADRAFT_254049 [Phanerochaete carnosa HHB-10118-sp]EKM56751.1 hypothetical protein PHACADRAFT_254049 [Phanerochaete carnosa HHB-10118-sp]